MNILAAIGYVVRVVISVAGGSIALVVTALLVRSWVAAHRRARIHGPLSFTGGAAFGAKGDGLLDARRGVTYPLAALTLGDDGVLVELTEAGQVFAKPLSPPLPVRTSIAFDELARIERAHGGIRFRTRDEADLRDALVFAARRRDRARLERLLREHGLRLDGS